MESPFKDFRIRAALSFAAILLGCAYLAIVHHVLINLKTIREVPATVGIVVGSIEAALAVAVLGYAWTIYRRITASRD